MPGVYVLLDPQSQLLKIGRATNLETRRKDHEGRGFQLVGAVAGTRQRETQIKQSLRSQGIKPKNGTEEYQLTPEVVEAFAQQGLPIGELCCTKPKSAWSRNTGAKTDRLTPPLF